MKKAPPVRLSLRKLLTAMLAVGPVAILPSPVLAALPSYTQSSNTGSFTVSNGTVQSVTPSGSAATISASNRAVLVWGQGNFNIASGETYNFQVDSGGAVLNKVGYTTSGTDTATIAGILNSSGKVFVLANGTIDVKGGATILTQGGLYLSTLAEANDFNFTTSGNLTFNGTSQGAIKLGSGTGTLNVSSGGVSAWAGTIVRESTLSVVGDLVLNPTATAISLAGSGSGNTTTVNGNLTVVGGTNVNIAQGGDAVIIQNNGTTSLTTAGTGTIALANTSNDFDVVTISTGTGAVSLSDASDIKLGASTIGADLSVTAVKNITTTGAVVANNTSSTVTLTTTGTGAVGNITFASGSSVAGNFTASAANGTITANTVGNLTVTNVSAPNGTTGGLNTTVTVSGGGTGYTTAPTVAFSGGGGSGAIATATVNTTTGQVTGVTITNPGSGYTTPPTISFTGGGANPDTAATATVALASTGLTTGLVSITAAQGGVYDGSQPLPTVSVTGGTSDATLTPVWTYDSGLNQYTLAGVTVATAGTGYTTAPTLTITGGTAVTPASASYSFTLPGRGLDTPAIVGGTGYTTAPSVTFSAGNAVAGTPTISSGSLATIPIASSSGYTTAPTITITGGGSNPGSVASATATISKYNGNVTLISTGTLTINGSVTGNNATVTSPTITSGVNGDITVGNNLTYNATNGDITLPASKANRITITATGGVSQYGSTVIESLSTATANATSVTFGNSSTANLTNANKLVGNVQLKGGTAQLKNTNAVVLGTTNLKGDLTVTTNGTGKAITLGAGSGSAAQTLTVGGNMTLNTESGAISDDSYSTQYVYGATTINTTVAGAGASVTLNAAAASSNGATGRFGQLSVTAGTGALTYSETTAINLGNITAASATVRSTGSDIVVNGALNTGTGAVTLNASNGGISQGSSSSIKVGAAVLVSNNASGVSLGGSSNDFVSVNITNGGNNIITSNNATSTTILGNSTAGTTSVTISNSAAKAIVATTNNITDLTVVSAGKIELGAASGDAAYSRLTLTANSTDSDAIKQVGFYTVNNTLTLSTLGGVQLNDTATYAGNITGNVVLTSIAKDAEIFSGRNLTVSGTVVGNLTVKSGEGHRTSGIVDNSYANPWALTLGNLAVSGNLTAEARNGANNATDTGSSGKISQVSGSVLHVEQKATFISKDADIVVANNGNSAGRVELSTGGSTGSKGTGTITYTEDATAKIGNVATKGNANLSSRFGGVIEDPAANVNLNVEGRVVVSAVNGSINLGNTTHTSGSTTADIVAINMTASGAAQMITSNNVSIGSTSANSLTVTASKNITQSAPINVYGVSTFNSTAQNITLENAANNFGPVVAIVGAVNKNIKIAEDNTLNLRTVTMPSGGNGTVTLTSNNGDIIDTGLGGVKLGGNSSGTGTGLVTLSAVNGNIAIDDPTSDVLTSAGVVFNAKDVNLSILGSNTTSLILGNSSTASVATGNLIASTALGSISSAGSFTVGGNANFQAPNGNVVINQANTGFGTLKFVAKQVNIVEAGNTDILTGSSASEASAITSGGNIAVVDVGGVVTFGSTVNMAASGDITLKKVQASNTITVNAPGTKDLSALSLDTDLSSKAPVNQGTGTYVAPKP